MIYLIIALCCGTISQMALRYGDNHTKNTASISCVGYAVSMLFAFLCIQDKTQWKAACTSGALLIGGIGGFFYLTDIVILQVNIHRSGSILPSTFNKLGVLLPTLVSIFYFHESPSWMQVSGIILAFSAVLLVNLRKVDGHFKFSYLLILLLLVGGITNFMSKLFTEFGDPAYADYYTFFLFASATVCSFVPMLATRQRLDRVGLASGVALGISNFFSTRLIVAALSSLPAFIVYPINSVGIIALVSLCSILVFHDRLSRRQWAGIGVICISLALLSI